MTTVLGAGQHTGARLPAPWTTWLSHADDATVDRWFAEVQRLAELEPLIAQHDRDIERSQFTGGNLAFSSKTCPLCRRFAEIEHQAAVAVGYVEVPR